eukprot:CCRYP_009828-RA/>CCRYP_009828-RA protein AED:0.19 eAED:1.00 QI:0/-1/0/1/-1/0/1/0/50
MAALASGTSKRETVYWTYPICTMVVLLQCNGTHSPAMKFSRMDEIRPLQF